MSATFRGLLMTMMRQGGQPASQQVRLRIGFATETWSPQRPFREALSRPPARLPLPPAPPHSTARPSCSTCTRRAASASLLRWVRGRQSARRRASREPVLLRARRASARCPAATSPARVRPCLPCPRSVPPLGVSQRAAACADAGLRDASRARALCASQRVRRPRPPPRRSSHKDNSAKRRLARTTDRNLSHSLK